MTTRARQTLEHLLQELSEHPERAQEIEARIDKRFARDCAILVLDLSGFTRLTMRHGIVPFLVTVHRMRSVAGPIVRRHGGRVFKQEADNLFALFDDVLPAVDAAVEIQQSFAEINTTLPDDADLNAGIGIGYGRNLVIGDVDVHGKEMNLACKLGEDLARQGEILLTAAARAQLGDSERVLRPVQFSVAGLELDAFSLAAMST